MVQRSIPCAIMRGGTSKGIFFNRDSLPERASERTGVILKIFGSGDPMQIDGLGGTHTETSKTMIVSKSEKNGVDVDYLFGQVGVDRRVVDYSGNCGNLTSAIGPFAIEEDLVRARGDRVCLKLYNLNTKKRVDAIVPLEDGMPKYNGNYMIDGVPSPGAKIDVIWHDPGGGVTGKLLPTGNLRDTISVDNTEIEVSLVDAGGPSVFVKANDLGLSGTELPSQIDTRISKKIEIVRSKAAQMMGFVRRYQDATAQSQHLPFLVIVAEKRPYETRLGTFVDENEYDVLARLFSMQKMHHAFAVTGSICTSVAAKLRGTVLSDFYAGGSKKVRIGHPKGVISTIVQKREAKGRVDIVSVTVGRTARRLMSGFAYYP